MDVFTYNTAVGLKGVWMQRTGDRLSVKKYAGYKMRDASIR